MNIYQVGSPFENTIVPANSVEEAIRYHKETLRSHLLSSGESLNDFDWEVLSPTSVSLIGELLAPPKKCCGGACRSKAKQEDPGAETQTK